MSVLSRSNWNLKVLVFKERGKPEYPEKNLSEQRREPTTNSTHIWRQHRDLNPATLVGDECSHHCATLAPHTQNSHEFICKVEPSKGISFVAPMLMLLSKSRRTSQEAVLHNPLHIKSMVRFILIKPQNGADVLCVHTLLLFQN